MTQETQPQNHLISVFFCWGGEGREDCVTSLKDVCVGGVRQMQTVDWQIADFNGYPKPPSKANQIKQPLELLS